MTISMTMRDIDRYIDQRLKDRTMSTSQLEAGAAAVQRGAAAKLRLRELAKSPDFVEKFRRNDPQAVEAYRVLTECQAEGVQALVDLQGGSAVDPSAEQARQQQVQALIHDPAFRERYARGDADALRQWREVSVDGAAAVLGVDPTGTPVGQSPSPSPAPAINPSAEGSGE